MHCGLVFVPLAFLAGEAFQNIDGLSLFVDAR